MEADVNNSALCSEGATVSLLRLFTPQTSSKETLEQKGS